MHFLTSVHMKIYMDCVFQFTKKEARWRVTNIIDQQFKD